MMPDPPGRINRLTLALAISLVAVIGVLLALIGVTVPGYADGSAPNIILQVLRRGTPTPVPTPVAAACDIQITQGVTVANDTAQIEIWNRGAAATVQAITLVWPEGSGNLQQIRLGDRPIWSGQEGGPSTTVFPDRTGIRPSVKANERASLALKFSDEAVNGRYTVLLHLGRSCYVLFDSEQTTAYGRSCFATFDQFRVDEQQAMLALRNTTADSLSLSRLLVFWPSDRAALNNLQVNGSGNLIREPATTSPTEARLPLDLESPLQPNESMTLSLTFDDLAPLIGYTIVVQTDDCQSVFSNAEAPTECPVRQAGEFVTAGQVAGLMLQNVGDAPQAIQGMLLTFPDESTGTLEDVTLNGQSIADHSSGLFPKSSPATMTAGVDLLQTVLAPNSQSTVGFVFERDAEGQHYAVQIDLPNECHVLATTRTEDPLPCEVQIASNNPVELDGDSVQLAIRNTGEVEAELQAVTIDWPEENGALTAVYVNDELYSQERRTGGTATVTYTAGDGAPVIPSGQSATVRFIFEGNVAQGPYTFRLNFVEGCQLAYETQDGQASRTPVEFGGWIEWLPENVFNGEWHVRLSADELLYVRVTEQTLFEPPGLSPSPGDIVRVRAVPTGEEDHYLATFIRITANVAEPIQLTGVIEEVGPNSPPDYITVQGIRVDIVEGTEIQGEIHVGWIADVVGLRRVVGSIVAYSIITSEPESNVRQVAFEGILEDWRRRSADETIWLVSGVQVVVHRVNTIHHGIGPDEQPAISTPVRVKGDLISADEVRADEVWYGVDEEVEEFSGIIRSLPEDDQYIGIWTIEESSGGEDNPTLLDLREVLVTESTFLDTSEASPAVGAPVDVRARRNPNNTLEALRIKVRYEED